MSTLTGFRITEEQKKKYREDGFFILENVIPEQQLVTVRKKCVELIEQQNSEMDSLGTDILNLSRKNSRYFVFLAFKDHPELGKFIFSDLMAEICRATIGDQAFLFWEQFVVKGTDQKGAEFTWHQDSGYVDYQHKYYVNAWIPLDDVNEENGTVYLLPYSLAGTKDKIEHKPVPGSNDREGYFGPEKGVPANCPAGSIVVFSSTTFHRSGANKTNKMRRAYAIQFSPEPIYEADGSLKGLAEPFLKNGERIR
ncbi:MAG TPA: phytanoyl-CoA dioxygenase family protein [Ignavibacteriaceae bacterium]|jgi:ectoine hydroxylase-related dioxygenase (phytanoyl-CoA dioxygenase family)|nr:phytanoyl-CoA dioxygenase family protein [Ignavibacteriaceae bacterium]